MLNTINQRILKIVLKRTHIAAKTPVRLKLIQEVKRGKEILVTAEAELAVIDSNGLISKLPKNLFDKI